MTQLAYVKRALASCAIASCALAASSSCCRVVLACRRLGSPVKGVHGAALSLSSLLHDRDYAAVASSPGLSREAAGLFAASVWMDYHWVVSWDLRRSMDLGQVGGWQFWLEKCSLRWVLEFWNGLIRRRVGLSCLGDRVSLVD